MNIHIVKRMADRADQMINIETQIGPIYLSYPDDDSIDALLKSFTIIEPDYDFESFDKSHHRLWCVNNQRDIEIALATVFFYKINVYCRWTSSNGSNEYNFSKF